MLSAIGFRYILRKLVVSFLVIAPVVIIMGWITLAVKYVGMIVTDNVTLSIFFKLVILVLPRITEIVLPICALISSIIVINKMRVDKELIVFMTSGSSAASIATPVMAFATAVAAILLCVQISLAPYAYKEFEAAQTDIKNQISMSIIKPGIFNMVGDAVIYVGAKNEVSIEEVFILHAPKHLGTHTSVITAKSGHYVQENENVFVVLHAGCRQELDEKNAVISSLRFAEFTYDITPFFRRYYTGGRKAASKTQTELRQAALTTTDQELRRNYIAEYHSRLTTPLIPLLNTLIIVLTTIVPGEYSKRRLYAARSFLFGIIAHIAIITIINISTKQTAIIKYNYMAIFAVMAALITAICWRKSA
ncbi:MAG: LptF/LptG family permease [Holosporales bacterium]|jgi:lipopolysaccharide export system permease protein|nr:LptF/LptG family permease [Holosporales bacterium]